MTRLTIQVEGQLLDDMTALARVERRGTDEIAHAAIVAYVRERGLGRRVKSIKAGRVGISISVTVEPRQPSSLEERKRLGEQTSGIWKDREVDGLQYQLAQRAEW